MLIEHSLYIVFLIAVYGIATQQGIEFIDALLPFSLWKRNKKILCKTISFVAGCTLFYVQSRFLLLRNGEILICGLSVAAASEAWNSILKVLVYAKEQTKAVAGRTLSISGNLAIEAMAKK